ncbi:hypothetical protein [Streptomyces sp. SID5910]|uniref:hypothetical protein n=1 Tax=Streptomyces sp. SID5910 TaxID=2690312 RepID=UPI001F282147|nr:hypothetical protein [Streptomyces sp. SID5910]
MSEQTPSQAEGERDDEPDATDGPNPAQTTPSQAEGDRDDEDGEEKGEGGR